MSNAQTVGEIYQAFGRGDVAAILTRLADDVEWEYPPTATTVPWLEHRRGRDRVAGFFASLGELEFVEFTPKEILEGDGVVVALIDIELVVKRTGQRIVDRDELHLWRFDPEGRVTRFKHGIDSHRHQLAWQG